MDVDAVVAQYGSELEFRRLCHLVTELLFAFLTPDGGSLFANDDEARHAVFFLALRPSFVGASIIEINEVHGVAKWYLRILERFFTFHDSTLKTKNFQVEATAITGATDVRRHAASRSVDSVYKEIVGRLQGWVQVEVVYALQHFYNFRAQAFEAGGHRPTCKDTRTRVRQLGAFFQNDPDSFDDLLRSKALTSAPVHSKRRRADEDYDDDGASSVCRSRRETSWKCNGSLKEELALGLDATLLAVVVVGRKQAQVAFPERLDEFKLDFPAGHDDDEAATTSTPATMCLFTAEEDDDAELEGKFNTPILKLGAAERDLAWFARRSRRAKATAVAAHRNALLLLEKRIDEGERAVAVTRKVAHAYAAAQAEQDRVMAAVAAENATPAEEATAFALSAHGVDGRRKMATDEAIECVWDEIGHTSSLCTWRESVAMLVGSPYNGWAWDVDEADGERRGNSKVLAMLKALRDALRDAMELVQTDPHEQVLDFVSFLDDGPPGQAPLEVLTKTKTYVRKSVSAKRDEEADFVGFAIGAHPGSLSDGHDIVSFVRSHVSFMRRAPIEFVRAIVAVVRPTLLLVCEWLGVLHPHGHRLTRAQKPRTNVGVTWLLRCLCSPRRTTGWRFLTTTTQGASVMAAGCSSARWESGSRWRRPPKWRRLRRRLRASGAAFAPWPCSRASSSSTIGMWSSTHRKLSAPTNCHYCRPSFPW